MNQHEKKAPLLPLMAVWEPFSFHPLLEPEQSLRELLVHLLRRKQLYICHAIPLYVSLPAAADGSVGALVRTYCLCPIPLIVLQ